MSLPEGQNAVVYGLGVSTNGMISGIHGADNYKLLTSGLPSGEIRPYLEKCLPWAIVPIGLGVLSLLAGTGYCLCSLKIFRRCRSNCCKGCKKKKAELNPEDNKKAMKKKNKMIRCQFLCLSVFSVCMLAFAIIGFVANGQFADSISGSKGALDITSNWFRFLKASCKYIREPIKIIGQTVSNVIGLFIIPLLADTSMIESGTLGLTTMLEQFSVNYSDITITAGDAINNETFDCAVCTTIADKVSASRDQIIANTQPMFDELTTARTSLSSDLVDQNKTIVDGCNIVDELIASAESGVDDIQDLYEDDIRPEITKWNNLRTIIFSLFFAFPLLPIILSAFTILTKKTIFLTIQNGLTWFTCSLISIILGIHLIITVVLADICALNDVVLNEGIAGIEDMKDNAGADIIQDCFDNIPLLEVFNMSGKLDFGETIDLDFDFNTTSAFNLDNLADLRATIAFTSTSTFNGRGDAALQACNDLIAGADDPTPQLTRDNIYNVSASDYYTSGAKQDELHILISTAQTTMDLEADAKTDFTALVTNMQGDMDDIVYYTENLKNTIVAIEMRFDDIKNQTAPILAASNTLLRAECGFIGVTYRELDESICLKMAPSIAAMCLSMILVVLMLLPVCCIGLYLKGNLQKREDRTSVFAEEEVPLTNPSRETELAML